MPEKKIATETPGLNAGRAGKDEPCAECPWRLSNHGRRHPKGWYRATNLRRMWNSMRRGGGFQTCHPTDPTHPEHQTYSGARPGSSPQECVGSIVLIGREIRMAQALSEDGEHFDRQGAAEYTRTARKRQGLTTHGMLWSSVWRAIARPMGAGEPLPILDDSIVTAD